MYYKNFRHFDKNFIRDAQVCPFCQNDLDKVDLSLSNSQELFVRCKTDGCKAYTIAEKKKTATGVLNSMTMCITY
jgi:hypothetical protein